MASSQPTLAQIGASKLARRLAEGSLRAVELVEACLSAIDASEGDIGAWANLDRDFALAQARMRDEERASGRAIGPLHGLPVGIKDIIDTEGLASENGTVLDAGRMPVADAGVVRRLKAAGAIIMGKTATTELAYFAPARTRNPHDPACTPGGSSSGSAAAVAAGHVPLAIGTQTNGSVIRPAAFCGVFGFKPSHGLIGRSGILRQSDELDTVGVMANSVEDAGLLAEVLAGHDEGDDATRLIACPRLRQTAVSAPPVRPDVAVVKTPVWDKAETATQEAFGEVKAALGEACEEVDLPAVYGEAWAVHRTLMLAGIAAHLGPYEVRGRDQLSSHMRQAIDEGRKVSAADYLRARVWRERLRAGLDEIFDRFDVIITPATPGEAPRGLESTGDPAFCTLWTLVGAPAITLPLLVGERGLPMGVQVVGRRGDDARLLRTANWLVKTLGGDHNDGE